jgi:hypothetical protein
VLVVEGTVLVVVERSAGLVSVPAWAVTSESSDRPVAAETATAMPRRNTIAAPPMAVMAR